MSLSVEYLDTFIRDGVVIIPNIIGEFEVCEALDSLHRSLMAKGCNTSSLHDTASALKNLSSTNGSGGILDIFYEDWKLKLNEHPAIVSALQALWAATYSDPQNSTSGNFAHPYGNFDPMQGFMYIDRVCFRVPTLVSAAHSESKKKQLQRSLTPHLDCCPHDMYGKDSKWRPIQAFLCLTDTLLPNQGGFEACLGHHRNFTEWAASRTGGRDGQPAPCVGDFTPMRPVEDKDVLDRMSHVPCKAGDLVCWDYRIPHANARFNHAEQSRAVVYIGLLPAVPVNERYAAEQIRRFRKGLVPTDQWHESTSTQECNYEFSELGKKLMGIEKW